MTKKVCLKCLKALHESSFYGLHPPCFLSWFKLKEPVEFKSLARQSISKEPEVNKDFAQEISSFFHGKFRKYSAILGGGSYLLKVKESEAPELPDVEYLSNQIAEVLGIPVAEYYFIEFAGERTFVTKNFVENKTTTNLSHIYHYHQGKGKTDCEALLSIIADQTGRFVDIETFIQVCLFDSLIGNHDRHGRNLGFLVTSKGSSLAPIYDNPSALGLESGDWLKSDFSPKGRIATQATDEPTTKDYVIEFKRLGYLEQVIAFAKRVNLEKLELLIEASFCSSLMKEAYKKLIHNRTREVKDELSKRS